MATPLSTSLPAVPPLPHSHQPARISQMHAACQARSPAGPLCLLSPLPVRPPQAGSPSGPWIGGHLFREASLATESDV